MTDTDIMGVAQDLKSGIEGLVSDFNGKKARDDQRFQKLEDFVAEYQKSAQTRTVGGPGMRQVAEGTKSMINHIRTGEVPQVQYGPDGLKAATVSNNPNGGYFAIPEFQDRVLQRMYDLSPMRQICEVISVSSNLAMLPYEVSPPKGKWVGETEKRDKDSDAKIGVAQIPVNEYVVKTAISNTLLEDSNWIGIEDYLVNSASDAIDRDVGDAFVSGDGFNKPHGLYVDKALKTVPTGAASAITTDCLFDAMAAVPNDALRNARWTMSMGTFLAFVKQFGKDSGYVNMPLSDGMPARLLGYPVTFINAPKVAAGNIVATFGDHFHAYKIVQRMGLQYQRDPFTGADDNLVYTRFRTRVGGMLVMPQSVVGVKVGAS